MNKAFPSAIKRKITPPHTHTQNRNKNIIQISQEQKDKRECFPFDLSVGTLWSLLAIILPKIILKTHEHCLSVPSEYSD